MERERLTYRPELDGLRALAVLAVIAFHLELPPASGYIGVDVFFVLSGFLITTLLWQDRDEGLRPFYLRRAARLLPALVVVAVIVTPLFLLGEDALRGESLLGTAGALTYSSAWARALSDHNLGWMGHTWSLSVEEWFYVVWPAAFGFVTRRGLAVAIRRVAVLVVVCLAGRAVALALDLSRLHVYNGPDFRAEQLLIGCLLALVLAAGRGGVHRLDGLLVAAAALFLVGFAFASVDPHGEIYSAGGSTAVAVASAVVVRHLFLRPGGPLAMRPLVWVGQRSYGLYLWHFPLIGITGNDVVAVALTVLAAAASYRFVEVPVRRRFRSRHRDDGSSGAPARSTHGPSLGPRSRAAPP